MKEQQVREQQRVINKVIYQNLDLIAVFAQARLKFSGKHFKPSALKIFIVFLSFYIAIFKIKLNYPPKNFYLKSSLKESLKKLKKVEKMPEKHIINFFDIILDSGPEERRTCQTAGENQTTRSNEGHGGS